MKANVRSLMFPAVIGLSASLLPASVMAENDISPSSEPTTPSSWEIRQHAEMHATELISRLAQGSFSTMCSEGSCGVFVEPIAGCVPGAKYPLLINSAKQVGVVPTQCTTIPGDKKGEVRYVVLLQQQKTLLKAMMDEMNLTIAFPTQAGQMNVLEINMAGVREVLTTLIPDMREEESDDKQARAKETSDSDGEARQYET